MITKFADAMIGNPPRLVVMFQRGQDGAEQYQWGVIGAIPVLSLIGRLTRILAELPMLEPGDVHHECPQPAFVISWDGTWFNWYVHDSIPVDSLMGMLETIKAMMVDSRLAQHAAAQRVNLLGPDGKPMRT